MRAILLAAGVGKRMGEWAAPKCLQTVGGKTLLALTLESLQAAGVREVVLVVGFRKDEVSRTAGQCAPRIRLVILENPRFTEGAILSLWTARHYLQGNLLIMDADVLFPAAALERLVYSRHPNCLLVDPKARDTGEEQMVFGKAARVLHITKRPGPEQAHLTSFGESIGFLKLCKKAVPLLRSLLEERVRNGEVSIEHEQVYPALFEKVEVGFEKMDGYLWTEIDTPEDLRRAQEEIYPRWEIPACVNRSIARWFLPVILRLPLSSNQWTLVSLLFGLAAVSSLSHAGRGAALLGALFFQLFYLTDNWDGEVARARGTSTRWGGWFDLIVDMEVQALMPLALALRFLREGHPASILRVGEVAAVGILLDFLVTMWAKARGFGPAVYGDPSRGRGIASDSGFLRFIRANLTNENFSLLVLAILLLGLEHPFLWVLAVGSQFFWIQFLRRERHRLFPRAA